jgi:ribonuclease-3
VFAFSKKTPKDKFDRSIKLFLRNILGISSKNVAVYRLALTHKSVSVVQSTTKIRLNNERLEYLGDAVLSAIVADFLFKKYPYQREGFLTEMRSKIVSRASLNKLAQDIGLSDLIRYDKDINNRPRSMDGDAFEALVGAVYLDKGYQIAAKIVTRRLIPMYIDVHALETCDWNYKSKLIAWGQKEKRKVTFEVVDIQEDRHHKQYKAQVYIDEKPHEVGTDYSIKAAEQEAAEKTYKSIVRNESVAEEK